MTVGPVIFSNEDARHQLVTEGSVITFRTSDRTTGETHVRYSRTGSKEFDCHIMKLADLEEPLLSEELERYHDEAGFESAEDWKDAIREMHGEVPDEGYLYKVATDERPVTVTDGGQPQRPGSGQRDRIQVEAKNTKNGLLGIRIPCPDCESNVHLDNFTTSNGVHVHSCGAELELYLETVGECDE